MENSSLMGPSFPPIVSSQKKTLKMEAKATGHRASQDKAINPSSRRKVPRVLGLRQRQTGRVAQHPGAAAADPN